MASSPFDLDKDVFNLGEKTLSEVLYEVNCSKGVSQTAKQFIHNKIHVKYLDNYLGHDGLCANYVVAERDYINKDYLTDYSLYYSSCFSEYDKVCVRLHFFTFSGNLETFKQYFIEFIMSSSERPEFCTKNYLGYIVVKPTPNNFIGFTLLRDLNFNVGNKCYSSNRHYWGEKEYSIHIFGKLITLRTLAFQEQDKNVAACATIAIWCMFQCAAEDYYVILRSPIQITYESGITANDGSRLIPNKGLSIIQMAGAITKNNMATEARDVEDFAEAKATVFSKTFNDYLKKLIYAYSPIRLPVILAIKDENGILHAITINGFFEDNTDFASSGRFLKIFNRKGEVYWNSSRISKVYVHDDQCGPFKEMEFGENCIHSIWEKPYQTKTILISTYQKIRISYDDIEYVISQLITFLRTSFDSDTNMVWDVRLFYSEQFKSIIRDNKFDYYEPHNAEKIKFKFLSRNFPKYTWVASYRNDENERIVDFIFDATGLADTNVIHTILCYSESLTNSISQLFAKEGVSSLFDYSPESFCNAVLTI